jgi:hypothetical protein
MTTAGFDDLYSRVIVRAGGAELVDEGIDEVLANYRPEFVRGCRERYSWRTRGRRFSGEGRP